MCHRTHNICAYGNLRKDELMHYRIKNCYGEEAIRYTEINVPLEGFKMYHNGFKPFIIQTFNPTDIIIVDLLELNDIAYLWIKENQIEETEHTTVSMNDLQYSLFIPKSKKEFTKEDLIWNGDWKKLQPATYFDYYNDKMD